MFRTLIIGGALLGALTAMAAEDTAVHYKLGTGDQIRIQVFGEDDLTLETRVGDSGKVSYPFVGDVQVAGLSLAELERTIVAGLKPDYLLDPSVNVSVVEYRPFFIYGEVKKPGGYPFQPGLTVEKAVALAEGFTERASRNRIVVVHDDDPAGTKQDARINTALRPGDTVTIEQSFF